jgi:predicted porin
MNKKLLAVAVGATLAASAGAAMAEVTVYGMAHVSVDYVDYDLVAPAEVTSPINVSDNSSRFGIKAKEDLGGGWAGLAQFEIFVDNTESNVVNANRNNYVGIEQKSIGSLLLGRMDSAVKDVGGIADLFYREQLGEARAITQGPSSGTSGNPDARNNESVTYNSPKFGPASFKVQWVGNDSQTNTNTGINANVKLSFKPVTVGVAYYVAENTGENTDGYRVAAKAPIGPVTLASLYQQVNGIQAVSGADRSVYGIGAAFKFGNNTVKAQYYVADTRDDAAPGTENGATQLSVGYDYNFSKKTVVYVSYAKLTNDDNTSAWGIGGNGHGETYSPAINGGEASGFSFGTRMSF